MNTIINMFYCFLSTHKVVSHKNNLNKMALTFRDTVFVYAFWYFQHLAGHMTMAMSTRVHKFHTYDNSVATVYNYGCKGNPQNTFHFICPVYTGTRLCVYELVLPLVHLVTEITSNDIKLIMLHITPLLMCVCVSNITCMI